MDHEVALVQAYLQINGYFTVAEYPIIESTGNHEFKTVTDLDILAFRFPGAGRIVTRKESVHGVFLPDPALCVSGDKADMLIGEIKGGKTKLNCCAKDSNLLKIALTRFGCCPLEHVDSVVEQLIRKGSATIHSNHNIRLVAFGSVNTYDHTYEVITIGHMVDFIENYLFEHWAILRHAECEHPAFGLFIVLQNVRMNMNRIES